MKKKANIQHNYEKQKLKAAISFILHLVYKGKKILFILNEKSY